MGDFGKLDIDISRGDCLSAGKALADFLTKCHPRELKLSSRSDAYDFESLLGLARCRRTYESVVKLDFSTFFTSSDDWQPRAEAMARVLPKFPCLKELAVSTGFSAARWNSAATQTFLKWFPVLPNLESFSFIG